MKDTVLGTLAAFGVGIAFIISVSLGVVVPGFVLSVLIPGANLIDGIMVFMMSLLGVCFVTVMGALVLVLGFNYDW